MGDILYNGITEKAKNQKAKTKKAKTTTNYYKS